MQVHKLHLNERNDIYKDVDPMNFEEFRTELSNSNNIYLIAELENEIIGICFSQIKKISNNKIMKIEKFCILKISVLTKISKKKELVKNYITKS